MSIVSAIVLFAVIWFMVLFIVLPIRLETQGDVGEHVPGTHAGSPASNFSISWSRPTNAGSISSVR